MPFFETPRFPDTLAYGATGGPGFFTTVIAGGSGHETRSFNWQDSKAMYEVGLQHRSFDDTRALIAFFNAVAKGRCHGFRFKDFQPGEASAVAQVLGTGDDETTSFQLVKNYVSGAYQYSRPILKPVDGTVSVFLDDVMVAAADVSIDPTIGVVTLLTAPAASVVVTATFDFDVPVRFDVDRVQMQRVDLNAYNWLSIPLVEIRREDDGEGADYLEHWEYLPTAHLTKAIVTERWGECIE